MIIYVQQKLMPIKVVFIQIVSVADRVFCFEINGSGRPTEGLQTLRFMRFLQFVSEMFLQLDWSPPVVCL